MPSVTSLSFKASFTAKGMTLVIPPGWFKPTEGKTSALSSLKNNYSLEVVYRGACGIHGLAESQKYGITDMTQEERWLAKYNEVMGFIKANKRNPSRYDDQERYRYCNWMKHNKKLFNSGELKEERSERFKDLLELYEKYKRINQY